MNLVSINNAIDAGTPVWAIHPVDVQDFDMSKVNRCLIKSYTKSDDGSILVFLEVIGNPNDCFTTPNARVFATAVDISKNTKIKRKKCNLLHVMFMPPVWILNVSQ